MAEHKQDILFDAEHGIIPVKSAKDYRRAITNSAVLVHEIAEMMISGGGLEGELDELNSISDEQDAQLKAFRESVNVYDPKYLSDNLIKLADDCGLRISDLDDILGLSNGYIARTLKPESKKRLSIDVVRNLAELFKVNVDDLINRPLFEPSPDMKLVIEFLNRLRELTDKGEYTWRVLHPFEDTWKKLFRPVDPRDEYGEEEYVFSNLDTETIKEAYIAENSSDGLIVLKLKDDSGNINYDAVRLYGEVVEYPVACDGETEQSYEEFARMICSSREDPTGTLKLEISKVYNAINTHLRDFTIDAEAKSFIKDFMSKSESKDTI